VYEPDRTIDIGPVALAVDDRGSGSATPLVLMHGFTGGRIDFEDVIDDLATDRRVVAWDHRGHSDSTNTGGASTYTFDQLVDDAVAAVDALELDRFHLLGHSMGGIVAQQFVLAHPDRVESLILMDTLAESATLLPAASYDLWEERRGIQAFTVGAVWAGLTAAARFTDAFGESSMAEKYRKAASEIGTTPRYDQLRDFQAEHRFPLAE